MDADVVDELLSARSLYLLLGRVFLKEVDREFYSLLRSDMMACALEHLQAGLGGDGASEDDVLERLAVEYSALFIQPGAFPPYESVFKKGRHLAEPADQVEIIYQLNGFDYRSQWPSLFPDHIGLELNFVASLLDSQVKALEKGLGEEAKRLENTRVEFMKKRLCQWASQYMEKIAEATSDPFYNPFITFAQSFLESEAESVLARSGEVANV
ncbi:MAG: molecular chaperone TorD family protein [Nitrospinae bacterium]|nr:molecular chaperone TorD family protein [Nitrospinota bacterium]MBF0633219.1 molecular chaperone TorD family protein [Nitrospinota bacterium]